MHYVYLLKSKKDLKFYIGCADDLKRRFSEHNRGLVKSTKNRRPFELFYYEAYNDIKLARERERKLKEFGSAYSGLIKRLNFK